MTTRAGAGDSPGSDGRPDAFAARRNVTDPRAIRALAHPARLAVLDALSAQGTQLTATECAEIAGVSPSAMSYHLRALAKWGFVERVESSGDGRERPWRATARGWGIENIADPATAAATDAVTGVVLNQVAAGLSAWFQAEVDEPEPWRKPSGIANSLLWLTADEANELDDRIHAFVEARRDRTPADHPDGARQVRLTFIAAPIVKP